MPPSSIVVIGANAGGPQALAQLLPSFPAQFPGVIVVMQQMRPGFTRVVADELSSVCALPTYEPLDGQTLHAASIVVVPSAAVAKFTRNDSTGLSEYEIDLEDVGRNAEKRATCISATMTSAAEVMGRSSVGVLLTGMGEDGREGMRAIAGAGGLTIAQDAASSVVHDMALRAIDARVASEVLPLWSIADRIIEAVAGEVNADAA